MKKILYIVSTLKRSGPTNQLSYIIKYLDKNYYEPIVLTLSTEPQKNSMKDYFIDSLHVSVETLGLSRVKGLLFAKSHIKKFIKDNNIDLVHSQGIRADGLMSSIDIPRVATLRNYPYYDYPMTYGKFKGFLMAKKHLKYLEKINNPVVVSKSISLMLKEKNNYHGREWYDDEYELFENDSTRTEQVFDVNIRLETPDGITTSRLSRVIQRALTDSLYLYGETHAHTVSAQLIEENDIDINAEVLNLEVPSTDKLTKIRQDKLNKKLKGK